jgi:hypothetical protein
VCADTSFYFRTSVGTRKLVGTRCRRVLLFFRTHWQRVPTTTPPPPGAPLHPSSLCYAETSQEGNTTRSSCHPFAQDRGIRTEYNYGLFLSDLSLRALAKQSSKYSNNNGLLRRYAPRNDKGVMKCPVGALSFLLFIHTEFIPIDFNCISITICGRSLFAIKMIV